ncbi:unnamed protein product [Angiostrongylus costaricensis]|uniref:DUF667 domain-containing protein n=1 Tax=Angiostrongylus costaricensis TaxID=334426 RepID=A0A158PMN4_ANGCS|nr:unnamed protein product [Angiostrongylus costaricensis]
MAVIGFQVEGKLAPAYQNTDEMQTVIGNPGNHGPYADFGQKLLRCLLSRDERVGYPRRHYQFHTVSHVIQVVLPDELSFGKHRTNEIFVEKIVRNQDMLLKMPHHVRIEIIVALDVYKNSVFLGKVKKAIRFVPLLTAPPFSWIPHRFYPFCSLQFTSIQRDRFLIECRLDAGGRYNSRLPSSFAAYIVILVLKLNSGRVSDFAYDDTDYFTP